MKMATRGGRKLKRTRRNMRKGKGKRKVTRKTRQLRKQMGGVAHIPPEYFPQGSIVNVRDAEDYESPFFVTDLGTAERDFIAASDRPQDPYDEPGAESEIVAEVEANKSKSKAMTQNTNKEKNAESARRKELQEIQTLNRRNSQNTGSRNQ